MAEKETLHATCIAIEGRGVLLMGAPGSGKSSLALQLIDQPGMGVTGTPKTAVLVADDQVVLNARGNVIFATAPAALAGLLEIRGIGIVRVPVQAEVPVSLVVKLMPAATIERLPDPRDAHAVLLGMRLPMVMIDAGLASAPARLRAALDLL